MRLRRAIPVLIILGCCKAGVAYADYLSCAKMATLGARSCKTGATSAKSQADALAANHAQQVRRGIKTNSQSEADVTSQIASIYQSALSNCNTIASQCQSLCSDEPELNAGCMKEVGQFQTQLQPGKEQNSQATNGSQVISTDSTAKAREIDNVDPFLLGKDSPADAGAGAGKGSRTPGDATSDQNSSSKDGAAREVAAGAAPDGAVASPATDVAGAKPVGKPDAAAAAAAAALLSQKVSQFCGDDKNSACPSCGTPAADPVDLNRACTSKCLADPGFGPQLGAACRTVISKKSGLDSLGGDSTSGSGSHGGTREANPSSSRFISLAALKAIGRAPASTPSRSLAGASLSSVGSDFGSVYGPSIFQIHTNQISRMCEEYRLKCR